MTLTESDQLLLQLLRANARASAASLARSLGVSRSSVQERIARLERRGVIAGYTVRMTDAHLAQRIRASVLLNVRAPVAERAIRDLSAIPQVRSVSAISGPFDYLVMIDGASTGDLDATLDRIGRIEGVERTQTSIILSTRFER